jgi:hypothetical protein
MSKRTIREISAHDLTGRTLASHGISALSAIDRLARILLTWIRNKNAALRVCALVASKDALFAGSYPRSRSIGENYKICRRVNEFIFIRALQA